MQTLIHYILDYSERSKSSTRGDFRWASLQAAGAQADEFKHDRHDINSEKPDT